MNYVLASKKRKVLIDPEDFEKVYKYNWIGGKNNGPIFCPGVGSLARIIMDCPSDMLVDHKNNDKLDNRKSNLRICTYHQNNLNRIPRGKSGYKGVSKQSNRWIAKIVIDRKIQTIGRYSSPELAAKAYDKRAKEVHGEYAYLNFH